MDVLYYISLNTKINRLDETCLRMADNDKNLSFNLLLEKDGSVSIHHQNSQKLVDEMLEVSRALSPEIIN